MRERLNLLVATPLDSSVLPDITPLVSRGSSFCAVTCNVGLVPLVEGAKKWKAT